MRVDAAAVDARAPLALVDVDGARGTSEARRARAPVRLGQRDALSAVLARVQSAVVDGLALGAAKARRASTRVVVKRA